MSNEHSLAFFQHDPLPDSTTHIRLLEIVHGDFEQHVVCELSVWPLDTTPSYYALSYTWGDPGVTAKITVNGKRMVVRKNCEYALQQSFASKASRYFWVDAICIDQDTREEKNHQVAMMGNVYEKAAHVFACIGPHADDSEFMLQACTQHRRLLEDIYSDFLELELVSYASVAPVWISYKRLLSLRCWFTINASLKQRLVKALFAFLKRPYFTRVWVLQELLLGKKVSYCCGMDMHSPTHPFALGMLVGVWIHENRHESKSSRFFIRPLAKVSKVAITKSMRKQFLPATLEDITPQLECLAFSLRKRGSLTLGHVLSIIGDFQCADARDKLYGILSLVDWQGGPVPLPNYSKNNFEVASEVLGVLLTRETGRSEPPALSWASYLWSLFDVPSAKEALLSAIRVRSNLLVEAQGKEASSSAPARYADDSWEGVQISPSLDSNDPNCTEDWESYSRNHGLIIRGPNNGRYSLVGLTSRLNSNKKGLFSTWMPSSFTAWWHLEDLLICGWSEGDVLFVDEVYDKVPGLAKFGICAFEGSSYVTKDD
ncbi:Nn.00g101660.m01.CDS01 [Neocucurbitaria sp. VM-36]